MAIQGVQVTLTTDLAAVALAGDGAHGILRVVIRNRGTGTAYLGSSGVTSSGYTLSSGDSPLSLHLYQTEKLFAMSTGGAAVLDILRSNETTA